jgi:hypothetical protein
VTRRCVSWGKHPKGTEVKCDLCANVAVFHWVSTYPDLFLCPDCLEAYPEATDSERWRLQYKEVQNARSEGGG